MKLQPALPSPFLKCGFFGGTGTGKTFTAVKFLAQFVAEYEPKKQIAIFDTEPSAGFVAPMVKAITGKELLVAQSRSFSDMMDFTKECIDNGHIGIIDSITHPWRELCNDYLVAKKSRVSSAGGREGTTKLSLKDWGPIKDIWNEFSKLYVYSPMHFCIIGREGDVWETVADEEGKEEMRKTGVKMKTETEFGYEPSLLIQMRLEGTRHKAFVVKDRFDILTGKLSDDKPDIEFFRPCLDALAIGGKLQENSEGEKVFKEETGPNWETIKAQRTGLLENIKDDILLAYPGQTADEKKAKVDALRKAFSTSSWTELESDERKFSLEKLKAGRLKLQTILTPPKEKEDTNAKAG